MVMDVSVGLITDPIQQRSALRGYDSGSMLLHDEFHIPIQEYSHPLHGNQDWTYFVSRAHPGEYEFKKFSHSTMTATTIQSKIMLEDYTVLDSCQDGDVLDYLVVVYTPTGDVQVIDLKTDGLTKVKQNAKTINHRELEKDSINVECVKAGEALGKAYYEIGLVGSFYQTTLTTGRIADLYIARFSTKANFTTNYYESTTDTTSEIAKDIFVDVDNDRIYAVVDINTNKYYERTVYQPDEFPGVDNPNIAIIAFSFDFGTRLWVSVIGDSTNIDYYSGLSVYKGYLHVALTSHTDEYSADESQTDIIYTKIRSDNGKIISKKVLGSTSSDQALDIQASTAGIYIMAIIGDNFLPHPDSTKIWQTYGGAGKTNFAMLLIRDSDSQLIDIEGFDLSTMSDPYPRRFSLQLSTGTREFIFYAHRANDDMAGLYITKFVDSSKTFINDVAGFCIDGTNCDRCNLNDPSM